MGFSFNVQERLLRAGFTGKDYVIHVSFLRINKKKFLKLLEDCGESARLEVPVYILTPWNSHKIGKLNGVKIPDKPYMSNEIYVLYYPDCCLYRNENIRDP